MAAELAISALTLAVKAGLWCARQNNAYLDGLEMMGMTVARLVPLVTLDIPDMVQECRRSHGSLPLGMKACIRQLNQDVAFLLDAFFNQTKNKQKGWFARSYERLKEGETTWRRLDERIDRSVSFLSLAVITYVATQVARKEEVTQTEEEVLIEKEGSSLEGDCFKGIVDRFNELNADNKVCQSLQQALALIDSKHKVVPVRQPKLELRKLNRLGSFRPACNIRLSSELAQTTTPAEPVFNNLSQLFFRLLPVEHGGNFWWKLQVRRESNQLEFVANPKGAGYNKEFQLSAAEEDAALFDLEFEGDSVRLVRMFEEDGVFYRQAVCLETTGVFRKERTIQPRSKWLLGNVLHFQVEHLEILVPNALPEEADDAPKWDFVELAHSFEIPSLVGQAVNALAF